MLVGGAEVALDPGQGHFLRNVMRLAAGDQVRLFNEAHGEWGAEIVVLSRDRAIVRCDQCVRSPASDGGPWLFFAPVRRERVELTVEKATELGAAVLQPVSTRFTRPGTLREDRLRAIAREAAEQSNRLSVPQIRPAAALDRALAEWPADHPLLWCDETGGGADMASVLAGLVRHKPAELAILVGPEGGFAPDELDHLANLPFVIRAGLGPRILKAETAAIAALTCVQAIVGDWQTGGRPAG